MIMLDNRPYILLLDDEAPVREFLTRWLQGWGYEVVTVNTAEQALRTMRRRPAAMVIADLMMPGEHDVMRAIPTSAYASA